MPEILPFAQSSHVRAPLVFSGYEYLPALHTSQLVFLPSTLDDVPSAHSWQSTSDVFEQAMQPGNVLYLPAEHMMQGPPASEKNDQCSLYLSRFLYASPKSPNFSSRCRHRLGERKHGRS
jgi:hypothetical protein